MNARSDARPGPLATLRVRQLAPEEAEAMRTLSSEAFGMPPKPPTEPATLDRPGRRFFGGFDADTLAVLLVVRDFDSWFGGVEVPTAGIASVTVAMEYRGRGSLGLVFDAALADARRRGAVLSTLFPTAPGIYRRFGYELVSDYRTISIPSADLARVAPPAAEVTLRRATSADEPVIARLYDQWAAAQNGPLTRRGASFPPDGYLADFDAVTLAVDEGGQVIGYASWDRGQGYGNDATLAVSDLLALTPDGYRALLRGLGTFVAVTGHTKIDTSGEDVVRLFLPTLAWQTAKSDPYMLSVLDVVGAVERRPAAPGSDVDVLFEVRGEPASTADGTYRVRVRNGVASCVAAEAVQGSAVLHPRGLSLLYAGVQSCGNLRFAGLLAGGTPADDVALDALFAARPFHIRNYF